MPDNFHLILLILRVTGRQFPQTPKITHDSKVHEVYPQLHNASVRLLYLHGAVLLAGPQLREARRHEVRQVILDHATAGHLD